MPASDFSTLMAQMIAQARPPQAPGGGGRRGQMGGGTFGTAQSAQANVSIEGISSMMRLFGYKTPEEKQAAVDQLMIKKEQTDPEQWATWENSEAGQTIMQALGKTSGVIQEGGRWKVMTRTPEAQVRGLTEEQIYAKGGQPSERLLTAKKGIIEAAKPFEVEKFMATAPPAEITKYTENKAQEYKAKALAGETPMVKQHYADLSTQAQAAAEASRFSTKRDIEVLKYLPDEQTRASQESSAKIIALNAEAKRNNAHADYFLSESKKLKEEAKESNMLLKETMNVYRTTQNAWINAYAKGSVEERTQLMGILTGATERYISSVNTLKRPELGNDALSFWLSSTNDELSTSLEPSTGKLPTKGVFFKEVQPQKDMLFQQRASQIVSFMQTMGSSIDDNASYKCLDLFTRIYSQTTHTPSMDNYAALMVQVGKALGYPMTTLQNLITPPSKTTGGVTETPLGAPLTETPVGPVAP